MGENEISEDFSEVEPVAVSPFPEGHKMKRKPNPISQAMAAVELTEDLETALTENIPGAKVFNTHSVALVGMLVAQEGALREKAADVRQKVADLEAEYTDIMLAQSGITHAIRAIRDGAG